MNPYEGGVIVNDVDRSGMTNAQAALIAACVLRGEYTEDAVLVQAERFLKWLEKH